VVKEVIRFRLALGARTNEFLALYQQVCEAMEALGVEPGVAWATMTGTRTLVIEREFDSLAQYEADDAAFHGGEEFMALWRRMEATAESMEVELLQKRGSRQEVTAPRDR
jgi:hypothetical protein